MFTFLDKAWESYLAGHISLCRLYLVKAYNKANSNLKGRELSLSSVERRNIIVGNLAILLEAYK